MIVGYFLACRSYLFVCSLLRLTIIIEQTLSEDIELIKWFVECVSKIKHILSVIYYTICGAVCFQFTYFLCDDWDNIYTVSYYHHQIGSMNYYPLFRVRSWNNGMRFISFYIHILIISTLYKNVLYPGSWTTVYRMKSLHFDSNVINVCSQEAITLTKDDPGLRPIMASLGSCYKTQYSKR